MSLHKKKQIQSSGLVQIRHHHHHHHHLIKKELVLDMI